MSTRHSVSQSTTLLVAQFVSQLFSLSTSRLVSQTVVRSALRVSELLSDELIDLVQGKKNITLATRSRIDCASSENRCKRWGSRKGLEREPTVLQSSMYTTNPGTSNLSSRSPESYLILIIQNP